jgi:flagellar hook assembly protein FlgD
MSLRRTLVLLVAFAAFAPGVAFAQEVRVVARDVPLSAARVSLAREAPVTFTMVGIHWQGTGQVWFRTARQPGRFGTWHRAQPEAEDAPDRGSEEIGERTGWRVGNPWWTGTAHWIQYRVAGRVTQLRTYFVDSPVTGADRAQVRASRTSVGAAVAARPVSQPSMVRRAEWDADESIVRDAPAIASRLRLAFVHHTAGSNSYSRSQSAAIVRGIQRYHVRGNGWDDIGYNFLVDKYGRVFEGRAGGITKNVVGAHAGGFNTGSVGVAVLGNYDSARISRKAKRALQRLLAWRLDVGHVFPRGRVDAVSGGSSRYPAGTRVRLRAVSGHRDTSLTSCPGNTLYRLLGSISRRVTRIGLPKLWNPEAEGRVGGLVRFTARLSAARQWTVVVRNSTGAEVDSRRGSGRAVDWTWDATGVPITSYTYTISSGADVRPSTLPVPGPPPLRITGLKASPRAVTPNGDWSGERTSVSFRLTRRATLGARVVSAATGSSVRTLLASSVRAPGRRSMTWDGRNTSGALVPDGRYRIEVSAQDGSEQASRSVSVVVDRTLGGFSASPKVFSPDGNGRADTLGIGYELDRPATVRVQVRRNGEALRTLLAQSQGAGSHDVQWNGRANGGRVADGSATVVVRARTALGTRKLSRPIVLDTRNPVVHVLSLATVEGAMRLRVSLSEAARLRIWHGRESWSQDGSFEVTKTAGNAWIRRPFPARVVRVRATDAGLNRSRGVIARA